jgi:hypothetical protein
VVDDQVAGDLEPPRPEVAPARVVGQVLPDASPDLLMDVVEIVPAASGGEEGQEPSDVPPIKAIERPAGLVGPVAAGDDPGQSLVILRVAGVVAHVHRLCDHREPGSRGDRPPAPAT